MNLEKEYISLHKRGFFNGFFCLKYKEEIKSLIEQTSSLSILDYGCGKGYQYSQKNLHKYWNVTVECYDKYFEEHSFLSGKTHDGVICVEVLEHVPESEINEVLKNIFERSSKFVFLSIATKPAKKCFSDRTNVHILLKDQSWWRDKVYSFSKGQEIKIIFN